MSDGSKIVFTQLPNLPDAGPLPEHGNMVLGALELHLRALAEAHRRGEHTYGNMRRECPLCR